MSYFKKSQLTFPWPVISIFWVVVVLLPIFFLSGVFFGEVSPTWSNIRTHALLPTIVNTAIIVGGTAGLTAFVGTSLAIIMTMYDFKGKKILHPLVVLPLAIPPYIAAFTYADLLSFTGPIQVFLRSHGIITTFSIMNRLGAIFIFTFTLYPYVYMVARAYLKNNGGVLLYNAQLLCKGHLSIFRRVILPLLFPAVLAGVTFVSLEVVNDFGVANYFGIRTLSTLVFQAWYFMYDINLALRISLVLVGFVAIYLLAKRILINDKKYKLPQAPITPIPLRGKAAAVIAFPVFITIISFFIPVSYMVYITEEVNFAELAILTINTVGAATAAVIIIIVMGLIRANTGRFSASRGILKLANIGYSIPSPVLAIGVLSLFIAMERSGLLFNHMVAFSPIVLIFAYCIKYFSIGHDNIEKGYTKVGTTYTESSRLLGHGMLATMFRVDIFTIKSAIASGAILIFIDLVKELPLTLILRSFNFQSLSTRVYMFAINEQIPQGAPYSLMIVFICSIFVLIIGMVEKN